MAAYSHTNGPVVFSDVQHEHGKTRYVCFSKDCFAYRFAYLGVVKIYATAYQFDGLIKNSMLICF